MSPSSFTMSELDFAQIIKKVYDRDNEALRTTLTAGDLTISAATDSIRLGDGSLLNTITTVDSKNGIDVNLIGGVVSGTFTPTGLNTAVKASRVLITDVLTAIPLSSLLNRNGCSFRVIGAATVYFGDATVTAATGYPKFTTEEIILDMTDDVVIYAICDAGLTSEVAILEVA